MYNFIKYGIFGVDPYIYCMDGQIEDLKSNIEYWEGQVRISTDMFREQIVKYGGVGNNLEELRIGMKESHENLNDLKKELKRLINSK